MSQDPSDNTGRPDTAQPKRQARRRALFAGAGAAGLAAGAGMAARTGDPAPVDPTTTAPRTPPPRGGGYALTEHVKHYYRTTRI
ncbi:MAG: formate dehydrogenase [Burkholderiaceae bacterium]